MINIALTVYNIVIVIRNMKYAIAYEKGQGRY